MKSQAPVSPKVQLLTVTLDNVDQRIDNFLLSRLKGVPKSLIYKILRKGEVRVNKGRVKPEYKLKEGDLVRVPPVRVAQKSELQQPSESLSAYLQQAVLYEDKGLLVINKPAGLAVHGGSGVQLGLIESLRQIRPPGSYLELVHRLDKETSGCVMVAKNRRTLRYMQQLLREKKGINKVYQALVEGRWPKRCQQVKLPLLKASLPNGERIVRVVEANTEGAKDSHTRYKVLEHFDGCSLVEARPITGRTHQIRVHCQSSGHSILGDDKYGYQQDAAFLRKLGVRRLFLHAVQLEFINQDQQQVCVEAPLSDDLRMVLQGLSRPSVKGNG